MRKLIVLCGPTATGKTDIGIALAQRFHGEIISADSRHVYRGMDIGIGKDIHRNAEFRMQNSELHIQNKNFSVGYRKKSGVPIWLVDIVSPAYSFSAGEYGDIARNVIASMWQKKKLPILVGGSGLYIDAVISPFSSQGIPPNISLRTLLEKESVSQLQNRLQQLNTATLNRMNHSDRANPRRLIRAIEIINVTGGVDTYKRHVFLPQSDVLFIGLSATGEELKKAIEKRVKKRIQQGVEKEIRLLLHKGYTFDLQSFSAIGYSLWKSYIQEAGSWREKRQEKEQIIQQWTQQEYAYAKRQQTWFRKNPHIHWFDKKDIHLFDKIEKLIAT